MAVTMEVVRLVGAGPAEDASFKDKTSRVVVADDGTPDDVLMNGLSIPAAGSVLSYWAVFRLKVTAISGGSEVYGPQVYTDGAKSFGTGVTVEMGKSASYDQAVSAADIDTYSGISGVADAFSYTSGSPLNLYATNPEDESASATGQWGQYCVVQVKADSTASVTLEIGELLTFKWSES